MIILKLRFQGSACSNTFKVVATVRKYAKIKPTKIQAWREDMVTTFYLQLRNCW